MSSIAEALAAAIGADRVATDADAVNARRYDQWAVKHLRDWRGEAVAAPGCVVRPQSVMDVQKVVRLAAEKRVPLIPYGLGSGVCGANLVHRTHVEQDGIRRRLDPATDSTAKPIGDQRHGRSR